MDYQGRCPVNRDQTVYRKVHFVLVPEGGENIQEKGRIAPHFARRRQFNEPKQRRLRPLPGLHFMLLLARANAH